MRLPPFRRERPPLAPERTPFSESGWLNATAAIAVGMFIGNWVIGPSLSGDPVEHAQLRSSKSEQDIIQAAAARTDPFAYRTPTPDFGMPDAPGYGARAKQQAQAELGSRRERDAAMAERDPGDPAQEYQSDGNGSWQPYQAPRITPHFRYRQIDRASDISNY